MSDIIAALRARALATPSRVAVDDGHRSLCCADLDRRIGEIATLFRRNDCRVIGLLADNGIAWIVADLAALAAGGTLVPIPPYFTAMQLEHVVATSDGGFALAGETTSSRRATSTRCWSPIRQRPNAWRQPVSRRPMPASTNSRS